jgi:hypothetical protein
MALTGISSFNAEKSSLCVQVKFSAARRSHAGRKARRRGPAAPGKGRRVAGTGINSFLKKNIFYIYQ